MTSVEYKSPHPKLCILSLSPIHQDGRVLRQIEWASRKYDVTVIGWGQLDKPRPNVQMFSIQPYVFPPPQRAIQVALMLGGRFNSQLWERWYWRKPDHKHALDILCDQRYDVIHANEIIGLPIALKAAAQTGARVLFDAHEYSSEHRANNLLWRLLAQPLYTYLIRTYAPQAHTVITVTPNIAARYQQEFGTQVDVIMNTPAYVALPFHPVTSTSIRLIHHGAAIRERYLEKMIDVIALADTRYTLDFMLLASNPGYIRYLKLYAERVAPGRVQFREPVPPDAIPLTINTYDIGIFLIPPVNFSYTMALPNKFFEFIMAGLAVAIGPSPEMVRFCQQYNFGIVADLFVPAALAQRLNQLTTAEINTMKQNALQAAKILNAECEMGKLLALYTKMWEST